MEKIHRAHISNGKVNFNDPDAFTQAKWQLEGQEVDIIIRRHRKTRTNPQNAYYFGVVVKLISEHTGYTPDETHEIIKQLFFAREIEIGDRIVTIATTTKENTQQWEDKMTMIRTWASGELGIFIPAPHEEVYL